MHRSLSRGLACAALGAFILQTAGAARQPIAPTTVENFDIRVAKSRDASDYLERISSTRVRQLQSALADLRNDGTARLRADYPAIDVVVSPALGTAEAIGVTSGRGFLTAPGSDRVATLKAFLSSRGDVYGLAASEAESLEVVADYMNPAGNMGWVELEQRINGLPVFQGTVRGGFTAKGELARTTGLLASGIDASALPTSPSFIAPHAIVLAAADVGWTVDEAQLTEKGTDDAGHSLFARAGLADDSRAWLLYFPLAPGLVRLAWATQIIGDPMAYLSVVDAEDGTILFRKNLTSFQTQSATYVIYNDDSPAPMSPATTLPGIGTQAPLIGRTTRTLIGNEGPNSFNDKGWITDGANITDGNNVEAGVDLVAPNGVDLPTVGSPNRVFDFPYNPAPGNPPPGDSPTIANYRNGEVSNLFYWTNIFHDRTYLLGFTEAAHNFQHDNFGRGGIAGDRISAEAQDSSGTNNANFTPGVDGTRGRLQMFVWTGPTPDYSGGLDQTVILHELSHGLSARLHNNGSGLANNMGGGMGEGWSDFYARALLATADEDVNGIYPLGAYVTKQIVAGFTDNYYYGIRRFPYAVKTNVGGPLNRPHNPLTFADIDATQIDLTDGAFPRGPIGSTVADQVHTMGEVWAMALLEVRARFITRLGFAAGNQRILQFVTDGMKLDPANPTMLQGRDAIIAAAVASGGTAADIEDIWAGFATRGMGRHAQIVVAGTGSGNTRVVESFATLELTAAGGTLTSESIPNGRLDVGERVGVTLCVTNPDSFPTNAVTGALRATSDVGAPSAPQSFGNVGAGATVCRTFTFIVNAGCGTSIAAQLDLATTTQSASASYLFDVGTFVTSSSENFDGVVAPALPTGWTTVNLTGTANAWTTNTTSPDTAPNRATVADPSTVSDNALVSPVFALPAGITRVQFRNTFNLEDTFDGGVLEIAVGVGPFQDVIVAGGTFASNGYTDTLSSMTQNPIGGRQAWSGNSSGFVTTMVNLPSGAGGQNVRLRWRITTDLSVAGTGWSIDTFSLGQFVCSTVSPVAANDAYTTNFNTPLSVAAPGVLANDTGAATATIGTGPAHGALTFGMSGDFAYTPNAGYSGPDSFTYRANNVTGQSNLATVNITVLPNGPHAPTGLYASAIAGNVITLKWTAPATGPAPTNYVLEGGTVPSEVLASLPLGGTAPSVTLAAPNGTFFLRVHTLSGVDKSPASNEIQVFVNTPTPPSAPASLLGLVNGSAVGLAWRNTFEGGAPTALLLDVTGSLSGTVPLGIADTFSFGAVPPGTYTFALRAANAFGISAPSNPVTLTFPGPCTGVPQAPSKYTFFKIGNTLNLLWDPPTAGPAPQGYVLNVTGAFSGSVPVGTTRTLSAPVGNGTYNVSVQALNACGPGSATSVQSVTIP